MNCARIVTGASGMIGAALTRHLVRLPGTLLALDTHPGERPPGHPVLLVGITGPQFPELLVAHLRGADRAELYHTAGHVPGLARIADTSPEDFARTVSVNLTATYTVLRAFALAVRTAGIPASAVLLSSVGARRVHRYLVGYDAAKAGIESLARSFTLEFKGLSVRTAAIGPIAQSATTAADGHRAPALVSLVPRGAYADLDEIADGLAAFGSPCFDATAGHTLTFDGGLSIQLRPAGIERPPVPAKTAADTRADSDTGPGRVPNHPSGEPR